MRPDSRKRVDINPAPAPLAGMDTAFAGLAAPVVADAPGVVAPTQVPVVSGWKMGRVVLRRERAHRGGKTVIVVDDFATHLPLSVIETVARNVRAACGCGGTVKGRQIEIQGDQPAKVRAALEAEGIVVAGVK